MFSTRSMPIAAMCYSAQILADYKRYVRDFGADISIKEFFNIFWRRKKDPKIKIPKAMEDAFMDASSGTERDIRALIDEHRAEQETTQAPGGRRAVAAGEVHQESAR
jgi:hypothetical protein